MVVLISQYTSLYFKNEIGVFQSTVEQRENSSKSDASEEIVIKSRFPWEITPADY